MSAFLAIIAAISANTGVAETETGQIQPDPSAQSLPDQPAEPDWAVFREAGEMALKRTLKDPYSVQIRYISGFERGYSRPLLFGKRKEGWIACGAYNAKNGYGGYVGEQGFLILVQDNGVVEAAMTEDRVSTCDKGAVVPLQAALQD